MDITAILDPLNDAQREAVSAPLQPVLVLAGAGSGKTRVLVHRLAWLMEVEGMRPHALMVVTFTNKAAREMRGRVEALLGIDTRGMWLGTFHGLAHRLLRRHAAEAGLPDGFQVLDSDDQYRLIRRILREMKLDEGRWPPQQIQWYINAQKDEGRRPQHIVAGDLFERQMLDIYQEYERQCQRAGLVDFGELLLRAHELLRDRPALLEHYRRRFGHVLVDEFQDTNTIQYAWLRLLTETRDNLFVVGDDDQSIYGWRGARVENIRRFQADCPGHRLVRLEQNYRSTAHILDAANALIAHNSGRLGKKLWTAGDRGEPISVYAAFNDLDEARFVVGRIQQWLESGRRGGEAAILYRSNAQSRLFEEQLLAAGIPYRVYGGLRFFERAEIKSALAYLRLLASRDDDPSFERVVNLPTRGIGPRTLDAVREHARNRGLSLWRAAESLCRSQDLPARARNALGKFLQLVDALDEATAALSLPDQVRQVVEGTGLLAHYAREKGDQGEVRVENLKELVNAARQFALSHEDEELSPLDAFLANAALEAGETQAGENEDSVQLMTLHAAKGLEFPLVFMVGMEEGLFPSLQSLEDAGRLEEERRLCYVGMTRAMEKLYLTHAECRRLYGRETYPRESRFLREIPAEHLEQIRETARITRPAAVTPAAAEASGLRLGQRVVHEAFGEGTVLQCEGQGKNARVQVNFDGAGVKWLMLAYANLEPAA
ncbi:DNA helicase II/ATP-dependent DNA helicase PcrA [Methylomarinovum caldicuralii]|uniref:DNA 3'-5' helicase n=1 Tax=Methylomarinovum caldicuralii TaxID=438856 RepID=A0AAU9BWT6_9GAMM|nr:DNA helicase II [Methylomarinovum caldicuralii]BCX80665.1 DNA helicase II/ATP-dependent DNA helicase PcrA [Methylomarinovum caldicuralii]